MIVAEQMRISPKSIAEISYGGLPAGLAIKHAINEILLGHINIAICYGAERKHSMRERMATWDPTVQFLDPTVQPFTWLSIIWAYACSGRRYMYEFGASEEHFAIASVRNRKNAVYNPWRRLGNR